MKKLGAILLAVALVVGLSIPMAIPAAAHVEGDPQVETLYAGQDIDVGTVSVWNDDTTLYVTYEITEPPWVITETHLYVGKNVPFTTAPGQFPYDDDDADSVTDTEVTYVIPLGDIDSYSPQLNRKGNPTGKMVADDNAGVEPCDDIVIAAHAVVNMIEEGYTVTDCLVSGAGTDNVLYLAEGAPGYPVGYPGPYLGTSIPSVLAWTHSAWGPYGVAGAQWIDSSNPTSNTDNNTWRLFTRSFSFPNNATNISGTLTMNCDNAEEVYLNGTFVGLDTYAPATKIYGDPPPPSGNAHGWNSVESWDVSSILNAGNNDLWTMTRNYAWGGGPYANPTGLIYGLCYEYDIPDTVIATETAWGDGEDFEHPNWAMYFEYTVQGCRLVDTVHVPSDGSTVSSSVSLETGKPYSFKASGTFTYNNAGDWADAEWYLKNSVIVKGDTEGSQPYVLDISVDGYSINRDWGDYSAEHIYYLQFTGTGSSADFSIYDSYYPDNSGSLTVEIYECCE